MFKHTHVFERATRFFGTGAQAPRPASPSPCKFWQGREAGADRGNVQSGNAGGDDRHDPVARELFYEQVPQIGFYRIQRKT